VRRSKETVYIYTRTHTRTHARVRTRTHARARPHARTPARPHARTPARPHAHVGTQTKRTDSQPDRRTSTHSCRHCLPQNKWRGTGHTRMAGSTDTSGGNYEGGSAHASKRGNARVCGGGWWVMAAGGARTEKGQRVKGLHHAIPHQDLAQMVRFSLFLHDGMCAPREQRGGCGSETACGSATGTCAGGGAACGSGQRRLERCAAIAGAHATRPTSFGAQKGSV